jgi:hypothetical protein
VRDRHYIRMSRSGPRPRAGLRAPDGAIAPDTPPEKRDRDRCQPRTSIETPYRRTVNLITPKSTFVDNCPRIRANRRIGDLARTLTHPCLPRRGERRFAESSRLRIVGRASGRLEPNSELTGLAERIPQCPHATDPPVFNGDEMRPFPCHLSPAGGHRPPDTNVPSRRAPADRNSSAIRDCFNYLVVSAAPRGRVSSVPVSETLDGIHAPRVVERIPEQAVESVKPTCVPDVLHQRPNDPHSLVIHVRDGTNKR